MNKQLITLSLTGIALPLSFSSCSQASHKTAEPENAAMRPNIVFILADDMGYGDVSALNVNGKIATPHIDRIARAGVVFTDAHSGSAVSTPTRYGILTGRYAWRTSLKTWVLPHYGKPLILNNCLSNI